jgi:hypothetical protein
LISLFVVIVCGVPPQEILIDDIQDWLLESECNKERVGHLFRYLTRDLALRAPIARPKTQRRQSLKGVSHVVSRRPHHELMNRLSSAALEQDGDTEEDSVRESSSEEDPDDAEFKNLTGKAMGDVQM